MTEVILVNEKDQATGTKEKLKAHQEGLLHRAFSIFTFNNKGELLIQQRASHKYHSRNKWANTCCSPPVTNSDFNTEARKRLQEEMGFECELKEIFSFIYKAKLEELTEHELDHVFIGEYNNDPNPNPEEVQDFKWITLENLKEDMEKEPDKYAYWFKHIILSPKHFNRLKQEQEAL